MNVTTVLVTGCGGAIGLGAAKALRMGSDNLRLVGVDADLYAACFYLKSKKGLLDKAYVVPRADQPDYTSAIIKICRREKVDVIFPCTDSELKKLSLLKAQIASSGTKIIISPMETIEICRDKWLAFHHLSKYLPFVRSSLPNMGIHEALQFTGLPAIIKPRKGWGSRQVHKVRSVEEAQTIIDGVHEPVIQAWLQGEEYTVDGLTDRCGKVRCLVPRRRIKVLGGVSFQGITVRDKKLIDLGERIAENLQIVGPFNFQAKKIDGEPKVFEINPRFAGTGILSARAGANIPSLALKEACGLGIPAKIDFDEGLVISRYLDETFFNIDELLTS